MLRIAVRKLRSLATNASAKLSTARWYVRAVGDPSLIISKGCTVHRDTVLKASDGGALLLGENVTIESNVKIVTQGGRIVIGRNVFIGTGSIIVARSNIEIGDDCLIAEYVVIRDQDHEISVRPIRSAGFVVSPIKIGHDVWIGSKASILRGVSIGDRAVIGAHAVVRGGVPSGMLAVGVPARILKQSR